MKPITSLIKKLLSSVGYELIQKKYPIVQYENFRNLSVAYESLFNDLNPDNKLSNNKLRPNLLSQQLGTPPSEAYCIIDSLERTRLVDGDICEFGVAQGATSALIANEIANGNKILHLFDSFEGLPKPTEKDILKDDIYSLGSMDAYTGKMSCPEDMALNRLQAISFPDNRRMIHKGYVNSETLKHIGVPQKVSFAYIDFDFYEPILDTLNYLDKVMPIGSIVVVDDYDFFSTGVKTAVKEFLNEKDPNSDTYELFIPDNSLGYFAVLTKIK